MYANIFKAGVIDEMVADTWEDIGMDETLEEEADEEIDKVLNDLTGGILGKAATVPKETAQIEDADMESYDEQKEQELLNGMRKKLEMLKS